MSQTDARGSSAGGTAMVGDIDMNVEVVVIPVSDVDRAKDFYVGLGWRLDADVAAGGTSRLPVRRCWSAAPT
jgi:catechol 2,3-dioxygenase-like lactoylglutathione lyase family enzyme